MLESLQRHPRRLRWGAAGLTSVVAGVAAASLVWALDSHASFSRGVLAFLGGALAAALFAVLQRLSAQSADAVGQLERHLRETRAMVNIRPLLGPLPLPFDSSFVIDPVLAERLLIAVQERRTRFILECGSGTSTLMIAACLKELDDGKLLTLEHDPSFAAQTRKLLACHGLQNRARVVTAPLRDLRVNGVATRWYGDEFVSELHSPIDVLFVDGPPRDAGPPRVRYPAVPLLMDHLAPDCLVFIDDADRPDERWTADQWRLQLDGTLERIDSLRGGWAIHRGAANGQPG